MKKTVTILAALIICVTSINCYAATRYLPASVSWNEYEEGNLWRKQTTKITYNSKKLISKAITDGKEYVGKKWAKMEKRTEKPSYTYYSGGKIKRTYYDTSWWSGDWKAYYNKYGYITKRISSINSINYTYKNGKLQSVTYREKDSDGDIRTYKGSVKYTYYKNKRVKTMNLELPFVGDYKLYLNKNGYITKITYIIGGGFGDKKRTHTVKYTTKKNQITKIKLYDSGKLYRVCTLKNSKKKATEKAYKSDINCMASVMYTAFPLTAISLLNIDNVYKNVF